jgi:septal ring factor EnvC (AmiA/AmiB activator)
VFTSVVSLCLVPVALGQSSIEGQREQLYKTRQRLESVERRLVELHESRRRAQTSVMEDEEKIVLLRRLTAQIESAQREKEDALNKIRRAMLDIHEQIEQRKQDLAQHLIALYKYGRLFELDVLLSAKTMPEVYQRLFYMRMLAEADRSRMDELVQLETDLRAQQDHFKYAAASLRALQDEYDAKTRQLQADKTFRTEDIRNIKREESAKEALSEELAAAAEQLENLIQQLEQSQPQTPDAAPQSSTLTGTLPWPVSGRVTRGFGEQTGARYGTTTRSSGIVIECSAGTPVKAVAQGRVSYAEEFMTYGNLVIVDHGDGSFSVYGSLQDIAVAVGETVAPGDLVGHAGSSMYFELRKTNGPVDPMGYLKR